MSNPSADDDQDPASAAVIAKIRGLMLIAGLTTAVAIAAVLGVIGYRLFTLPGSAPAAPAVPPDVSADLPKGARVISTAVGGERIVVTIEIGGRTELHSFDLRTLKPAGTLRLNPAP